MSTDRSLKLAAVVLFAGALASWGLRWHLHGSGRNPLRPRGKLDELPLVLAAAWQPSTERAETTEVRWSGQKHPGYRTFEEQVRPFADEYLFRYYQPTGGGPIAVLSVVHSKSGKDRHHHPEICIRDVTGTPEDVGLRRIVYLDDEKLRPVQRIAFVKETSARLFVYYWHYTFPQNEAATRTAVQKLHDRFAQPRGSVTVQVSIICPVSELPRIERTFLPAVDRALQQGYLPVGSAVGCDRSKVILYKFQ